MNQGRRRAARAVLALAAAAVLALVSRPDRVSEARGAELIARGQPVPRTWTDKDLADWALPVVGLGAPPGHFSEAEYYAAPLDNHLTYPVYHPDQEPPGYWERLQKAGPLPLLDLAALPKDDGEWVAAGQRVFEGLDVAGFRSADPALIARARSAKGLAESGAVPDASGVIFGLRWVPTRDGVKLSISDCAGCHTRHLDDGRVVNGAPFNHPPNAIQQEVVFRGLEYFFTGDSLAMASWRQFAAPWFKPDVHEPLQTMAMPELGALYAEIIPGTFARANGSPYFVTKVPDLIGLQDRRYLNASATHLNRGIADVMRYSALVAFADSMDYGSHRFYSPVQRQVRYRYADETLYALARYIYALKPPANPHPFDAQAAAGARVFERERCQRCHAPPLYTNNALTPARGFTPPADDLARLPIRDVVVGTDAGLALKTRKATGYYKVPSLLGLWYRGLYLHDGSLARLEDLFDPSRLREDYEPTGFKGLGGRRRAVPGHAYGLDLPPAERASLVAFLRTL